MAASPETELTLMPSPAALLLSNDSPSLFREGFYTPSITCDPQQGALPWRSVREVIEMADNALKAKQRAAERLARQLDALQQAGADNKLLQRAQRAEVDSGSLLGELQQLIQAKADVAQQRADLNRANALLMAERQLLCEQLQVSPDNGNLCQAVSKVLATARRAKGLDVQLRLLAKCQRELLLQLEAQREVAARAERQWQGEKQAYLQLLAEHGIQPPQQPEQQAAAAAPAPIPAAAAAAAGEAAGCSGLTSSGSGSLGGGSSSSAALTAQLMLMRMQSAAAAAAACEEQLGGSPHAHLRPGTPPTQDMVPLAQGTPPVSMVRRSHSLDSGLNSLTGLLDQLALGQLCGSEEGTEHLYDDCGETESWTMADTLSADMEPWFAGAAAPGSSSGGAPGAFVALDKAVHVHGHQQHLQPVQEVAEECCC